MLSAVLFPHSTSGHLSIRAPISLSVFTDTDKTDQFRSVSVRCSSELITDQTFLSVN
jgi:hypothetical protein